MDAERISKHIVAFVLGMVLVGGLVWLSMSSSLNELKEIQKPVMTFYVKDMDCVFDSKVVDKENCSTINEMNAFGEYVGYSGEEQQLSTEQLKELRTLISEADFNSLIPSSGSNCGTIYGYPEVSFSFKHLTDDPSIYIPCMYTEGKTFPLFSFIQDNTDYPIYGY